MNEVVLNFINAYNECINAWNMNFEDPILKERYRPFVLNHKLEFSSESLLLQIIDNYDFNTSACIPSLMFYPAAMQNNRNEHWIAFGEYVGYDLILVWDYISREVLAVDAELNQIYWFCARNEESFLLAFTEVLKIEALYAQKQNVSDSMLSETLNKCIFLAGGEKFGDYFKHAIGYGL